MINYSKQTIGKSEISAVKKCLKSNYLTQGPRIKIFENHIKKYCNSKYAISLNSATAGLHLSCLALGLKKGDWLWTVPNTFVASANCGLYCDAKIDLVDIEPESYNIDIDQLKSKLQKAKKLKKLPKILVVVHLGGEPANMKEIFELKKKYNFFIIEDASHALGSEYFGKKIGSCKYSEAAVFSFHPVKPITTGEGGVVTTNKNEIAKKIEILRTHGITKDYKNHFRKIRSVFYYEQQFLGFNYRMSDIEASIGIEQIKKLDNFRKKRNKAAKIYKSLIDKNIFSLRKENKNSLSTYHLFILRIKKKIGLNKYIKIFNEIRKNGIGINLHYFPLHKQIYYKKKFKNLKFVNAENYSKQCFSIPLFPNISKKQQSQIIKKITFVVRKNLNFSKKS